jgi:hypothetical protein
MRPEIEMLKHHADFAPHFTQFARAHWPAPAGSVVIADQLTLDADVTCIVTLDEIDAAQKRALAGTAWPNQAHDL